MNQEILDERRGGLVHAYCNKSVIIWIQLSYFSDTGSNSYMSQAPASAYLIQHWRLWNFN